MTRAQGSRTQDFPAGGARGRPETGLIVALDHRDLDEAESLANELSAEDVAFKIGLTLFAAHGPESVRRISRYGRIFCDLKLHDIPQQVAGAALEVGRLGVWMLSIHSSGGARMVRSAADALKDLPEPPILAAVTVLTSLAGGDLADVGQGASPQQQVLRLAALAAETGAGAVICSPRELRQLRKALGPETLLVSPGVRPAGSPKDDQARTMTPAEAAAAGATYVVVGRPITAAAEPLQAARTVLGELGDAAA